MERFAVERDELKRAVKFASPGTTGGTSFFVTQHMFFTGKNLGTYNDRLLIYYPLRVPLRGSVDAKKFKTFIDRAVGENFVLSLVDGKLRISCGKSRVTLTLQAPDPQWPVYAREDDTIALSSQSAQPVPDDFIQGLNMCKTAIGKENSRDPWMSGIAVYDHKLVASDDYRLSCYQMHGPMDIGAAIPAASVKAVTSGGANPIRWLKRDGWLYLCYEDDSILGTRLVDSVPDAGVLDRTFGVEGTVIQIPEDFEERLKISEILSDELRRRKVVTIELSTSRLLCRSQIHGMGKVEAWCECDYTGEDVTFSLPPEQLLTIIKKVSTMKITARMCIVSNESFQQAIVLYSR